MEKNTIVSLFSDPNFLAISLLENLLAKNCFVNVITDNKKEWQRKIQHLVGNKHFSLLDDKTAKDVFSAYSIIILGYGKNDPYEDLDVILKEYPIHTSKAIVLLPFEKYSHEENSRFNLTGNLGVVYLGDLLGARIDLESDLLITRALQQIYFRRTLNLPVGELIYPLFVSDVAKTISRWLFSFGPYGKETLLIGPQISTSTFWKENTSLVGDIKIEYDEETKPRYLPKGIEIKTLNANLRFLLTETYKWLAKSPKTKAPPKIKNKRVYPKYLKPLILTTIFVLSFPILLLIIASGTFLLSYKELANGSDATAENSILVAKTLSVISKEESRALSYIPLVGRLYKELFFTAHLSENGSEIAITGIPLLRNSSDLMNKVLGSEIYDPTIQASVITGALDSLYREISLLQADTLDAATNGSTVAKMVRNKIDFDKYKNLALQVKNLSQNLPGLLGKNGSKTYLVLFQNNMELRPTGGFIGSFGILTFDSGRISDLTINDVYSADGQLNGHVEPPAPIKKYLGEANWWVRDSNWDPDFPTSAKRAEWFLDKEMGRSVDGVFAIDLAPIKNILKYTGPVFLPDFNMDITSENLYQKTQAEVQDNFFPGTHKKASFLTALSRSLLMDISKLDTSQKLGVLKSFYSDIEARSIQMFFHDDNLQNPVAALRWDGGVITPECGQNCYADMVGLVEANLGVNKTNYFIERKEHLDVILSGDRIVRTLTVTLKNNANPALGPSRIYKSYVRLLSNDDTSQSTAKLITGPTSQDLASETISLKGRNETGVYLEVLGGQTKTLEFSWTSNVKSNSFNMYGVYLRKQAGTGSDTASLTINGTSVYNDLLKADIFSRVNW